MKLTMPKKLLLIAAVVLSTLFLSTKVLAFGEMHCGLRPMPNIGCYIGRCIDGAWEQVCNPISCGLKPIPEIGCLIGRCVNGAWEQVCYSSPAFACGLKPIPQIGCAIGRCVNGQWEQICN